MLLSSGSLALLFSAVTFASPVAKRAAPSFVFPGDAPFSVPVQTLANALTCPNGNPTKDSPPVLLVHGTASTGEETWGRGYVPALKAKKYTACYITLPNRSMGDMQISAEYVAYNLHYLSSLSGGLKPAVIAHSQGSPNTQWALAYWPSTRNVARAFIALSPDFSGIELLNNDSLFDHICESELCQASLWQQGEGSNYYKALHAKDFRALVPTSAIWSQFDSVVAPFKKNAQLPGATVVSVQDRCLLRPVLHFTMTIDAAAFALALDALNNGGKVKVSRASWTTCFQTTAKGMNDNIGSTLQDYTNSLVDGLLLATPQLRAEPALLPYAQAALP
ncbi:hypothetical protein CBER1_09085 [Cercospora berteroae]|uniref:AB hydrolase-1 domain-containing protein n=1 Tax=Cercospora berteroae TaxID=357750 RepID=A0A2S6C931_9PEZI|nr:hypothetical protein CBER1_09085 [Cercospora berteroae]